MTTKFFFESYNKEDFKRNLLSNNEKFMGNPDVIKVMNEVLYKEK